MAGKTTAEVLSGAPNVADVIKYPVTVTLFRGATGSWLTRRSTTPARSQAGSPVWSSTYGR